MIQRFASILTALLVAGTGLAADFSDCFIPGEATEYKIYWMGIPIAWSRATTDIITEDGRELLRITMIAKTYGAYKHIYEVDDKTEVVIDPETALPIRHDWIINEGSIHKSQLTTFNHKTRIAIYQDRISKDIREIPIDADTQEIFSFIYSNRNQDIRKLAEKTHKLLVSGKLYDLDIALMGEERIKLPEYGKVPSIGIEPVADFDGFFLRKGKIFFWISKENPRVVTYIKANVAVGSVTVKLHMVSGAGEGFWSKTE